MQILQNQLVKRAGALILIGLVFLLAIGFFQPPEVRADGGGFPTRTPTKTRTPEITLVSTTTPTTTFTSLPPYPLESSGGAQPEQQQQAASAPTVQPVSQTGAQTAESGSFLGGCLPVGILLLLAGILLVTFFFVRRTRQRPE